MRALAKKRRKQVRAFLQAKVTDIKKIAKALKRPLELIKSDKKWLEAHRRRMTR